VELEWRMIGETDLNLILDLSRYIISQSINFFNWTKLNLQENIQTVFHRTINHKSSDNQLERSYKQLESSYTY